MIVGKKISGHPVQRHERVRRGEDRQEALFGATANGCGYIVFTLIWTV